MKISILFVALAVSACPVGAEESDAGLPAMNYASSVASQELLDIIKTHAAFRNLDKELVGSPITLRITHTLQPTAGGKAAGALSAVLAGGTLGLLPVVTKNSLIVSYEVLVHGEPVASYEYQKGFTRAINIWANQNDPTYGLGQEGLDWVKSTAGEFTIAAAKDSKLLELKKEYDFYFSGPPAH
ncbi:MAG: hypothetical protein R3E77_11805 [Steroidobacteraceae bacterium]